jgi:hypothetical protein
LVFKINSIFRLLEHFLDFGEMFGDSKHKLSN